MHAAIEALIGDDDVAAVLLDAPIHAANGCGALLVTHLDADLADRSSAAEHFGVRRCSRPETGTRPERRPMTR